MSDRVPDTHITDDIARRVVGEALDEWRRHQDHVACAEYPVGKHPTFELMVANALSAALAGYTVPTPPDRGDVALRMAQGRQWIAQQAGAKSGMPVPSWDDLTLSEQLQAELEARYWIQAAVNTGVKIVPAGCAVVELPEPEDTVIGEPGTRSHARWDVDSYVVTAIAMPEGPRVNVRGGPLLWADEAEVRGAALIAAAREARRLAAGSQVGDQHGE